LRERRGNATPGRMLIGHQDQRALFLDALGAGRLHHAWLLAGSRGIGKRRFADWAALKLLSGELGAGETPSENPAAHLVKAGSHPDHRVLSPPEEGKGSATASILIDQVRELGEFLHSFPALSRWRTLIVDSIDDMNPNTSNAFLKELEEPRENTIYLLVSHAPQRLLPTIRSRCRTVRMFGLAECDTRTVLHAENPELEREALDRLARLAGGAPGTVAMLAGADISVLETALDRIASGRGDPVALARSMQPQAAVARLQALLALVPRRIAAAAKADPDPRLLDLYGEAESYQRDAVRLAYDRGQVAMALADIVARAGQLQKPGRTS
jgi:DNA polymerase III subunit delta'